MSYRLFLPLLMMALGENASDFLNYGLVMQPVKAVTNVVSLTAIICSILAVSWVALALLGF
jgi:hypothetical protein